LALNRVSVKRISKSNDAITEAMFEAFFDLAHDWRR